MSCNLVKWETDGYSRVKKRKGKFVYDLLFEHYIVGIRFLFEILFGSRQYILYAHHIIIPERKLRRRLELV